MWHHRESEGVFRHVAESGSSFDQVGNANVKLDSKLICITNASLPFGAKSK